jgi:hypothetical protein
MFDRLFKIFSSLRLTVICLGFGLILVFLGTLAQVHEGLYLAQHRWFRSFFVYWEPGNGSIKIPIFPGGYLVGSVLLVNLITAHVKRFQATWKKLGIHIIHAGLILLLIGQLATDLLSKETTMRFGEGETRKFSESSLHNELVFLTDSDTPNEDLVVSIPDTMLKANEEIRHPHLPFAVRVKDYQINARVRPRGPMVDKGPPPATRGAGVDLALLPVPETRDPDERNFPSAVIELFGAQGSLGTWLVATAMNETQEIKVGDKTWRIAFRWQREYLPFTVQLLKMTYEEYPGSGIPKNFQSRVRIENPKRNENREVDIYMNNPLRYEGLTFYQYQMGRDELDSNRGSSTLQVVRNPGWLTPYAGCMMVGGGMVIQFLMHLIGFITKRRAK